jgi:hypothetical protein
VHQHLAGAHLVKLSTHKRATRGAVSVLRVATPVRPIGSEEVGDAWTIEDSCDHGVQWWPVPVTPPEFA